MQGLLTSVKKQCANLFVTPTTTVLHVTENFRNDGYNFQVRAKLINGICVLGTVILVVNRTRAATNVVLNTVQNQL
ncbi:unnamed protein product [Eruca vesicaria subsp. sativa]|uniref:Uncharacterized protein n=1 Tax=Eruca vesicaria subsp. sativa TaxID=29727 RepID=A0ABC8K683_ERUVS|nr:unnamed protein product [Eruca vesicaria subsp. sativa]